MKPGSQIRHLSKEEYLLAKNIPNSECIKMPPTLPHA